jgi:hypothetical protein
MAQRTTTRGADGTCVVGPTAGRIPRTAVRATAVMLIGVTSACSSPAPKDAAPWEREPFAETVADLIAEAEQNGASDDQLALLEKAADDGKVELESARSAARAVVSCLHANGLTAEYLEAPDFKGYTIPEYRVVLEGTTEDPRRDTIISTCADQEFTWVSQAYQLQPEARQMLGEYVESKESVLRTCLEDNGVETDPDAGGWELAHQALEAFDGPDSVNCLDKAGIQSL